MDFCLLNVTCFRNFIRPFVGLKCFPIRQDVWLVYFCAKCFGSHSHVPCLLGGSKRRLEELLQQWSEWHAHHDSSSNDSSKDPLENGEKTYFPALHVGSEMSSTVSFWMDNQARPEQSKEFLPSENDSVPLYDRGFTLGPTSLDGSANLERGMETLEASRCFNCGSYNHALKECPKPRDNVAVNNARKQHNSKRNPATGPRCPTRYYQISPGGKYEGLRAGVLGAETRQCLGIGELDPPPWLNRMREIGYPPGYLDSEAQDEPSGITIFADEETKAEHEDGEIMEAGEPEAQKKMTVEFPGINGPIPENADQRRWTASSGPSGLDSYKNRQHPRPNRSSEAGKGHYRDQRRSRDYRDEGPPSYDHSATPPISNYIHRYGGYDSNYSSESHSSRGNIQIPSFARSLSDRGLRSPLAYDGLPSPSPHTPLPYSSSSLTRHSPHNYSPASLEHWAYDSPHNSISDFSSQRTDRYEHHRHHHRK
ncbi:uncharacterized protein LOC143892742 isoform X2 [Tasmannia lanceolata]|uniref:uncharacterized protein LOC143892742 isoform X2 n=1 Tax=Tasmannia lanceolata TaxID=3420 RepID=UPI0040634BC9